MTVLAGVSDPRLTRVMQRKNYASAYPGGGNAHLDVPLANVSVAAFATGVDDLIADQLFPAVPVDKESNKYYVIDKGAFLSTPDALRARRTAARRVEFKVSSEAYFCDNFALATELALEDLANADNAVQLRNNSALLITGNLRRAQEVRVANCVTSLTNLGSGTSLSGTSKWSDFNNSSPLGDVTTGHAFIRSQTGLTANTAVIDWDTVQLLRRHPELLDQYKYTTGGMVTMEQLAIAFRVSKILVGTAIKENALEGGASSMTNVWGNNCILAYVSPISTGLQTATLGLRFQWTPEGFPAPFVAERRVDNGAGTRKVEIVEVGHFQAEKLIAANLGYGIAGTI